MEFGMAVAQNAADKNGIRDRYFLPAAAVVAIALLI